MIETILELRKELRKLERDKNAIQNIINKKTTYLKSLEILTANQLSLFSPESQEKDINN